MKIFELLFCFCSVVKQWYDPLGLINEVKLCFRNFDFVTLTNLTTGYYKHVCRCHFSLLQLVLSFLFFFEAQPALLFKTKTRNWNYFHNEHQINMSHEFALSNLTFLCQLSWNKEKILHLFYIIKMFKICRKYRKIKWYIQFWFSTCGFCSKQWKLVIFRKCNNLLITFVLFICFCIQRMAFSPLPHLSSQVYQKVFSINVL